MTAGITATTKDSATSPLSVTKVRLAMECPRLMYLNHHEGSFALFRASNSSGKGIGKAFHALCDRCVAFLCSDEAIAALLRPPADQLELTTLTQQVQQRIYTGVFFPYLQQVQQQAPAKVSSLLQLWQGLMGLIRRWVSLLLSNRALCDASEVVSKTFLAQELSVDYSFELPNGDRQTVRGRFDSLIYDFAKQRLCVVEYKTYQATDPAAQLAQVALYSYMLKQQLGVNINSAVYSVLPDWKGVEYPWDQLEAMLHQLIPPKLQQIQTWLNWRSPAPNPPPKTPHSQLCDICPQRNRCQQYFVTDSETSDSVPPILAEPKLPSSVPPLVAGTVEDSFTIDYSKPVQVESLSVATLNVESLKVDAIQPLVQKPPSHQKPSNATQPKPPAKSIPVISVTSQSDTESMAHQLVEVLSAFNVGVDYLGAAVGPAFARIKLKPHLGVQVSKVLKFSDDLRVHLSLTSPPLIAPQTGFISVDLPRPDRQTAWFKDYFFNAPKNPETFSIALGVNLEGQLIEADLSDPNTCHFLVGGTTGSGKSEFLRSLLLSLLVRYDPAHCQIALVDPKRVTFPEFEEMAWLYEPIVKETEPAIALMQRLVDEMERRYQKLESSRCSSITAYNQRAAQPMPHIVCIFDEYADFMADKAIAKDLEKSIQRLGAKARAAGIHLIIATQRPEASVVTPLIRSNLPARVALKSATEADSNIILGDKSGVAAKLLGKGDLFYYGGARLQRLQSLFAPPKTITELL